MLITFKSKSSAEIVMYESHVKELFIYIDKEIERGVITYEEITSILDKINTFISEKQKTEKSIDLNDVELEDLDSVELKIKKQEVTISARLYPLKEMLKTAKIKKNDILWGI